MSPNLTTNLTTRQRAFVQEYSIDGNATQAAIRAGYSEKTARFQASRLLTNVNIAAEVMSYQSAQAERTASGKACKASMTRRPAP